MNGMDAIPVLGSPLEAGNSLPMATSVTITPMAMEKNAAVVAHAMGVSDDSMIFLSDSNRNPH